ncbi:TPA: hypothetical protein ACGOR8_001936 [Streptococcus suis]
MTVTLNLNLVAAEIYSNRTLKDHEFYVRSNGQWGFKSKHSPVEVNGTLVEQEDVIFTLETFLVRASAINNVNILNEIRDVLVEYTAGYIAWC